MSTPNGDEPNSALPAEADASDREPDQPPLNSVVPKERRPSARHEANIRSTNYRLSELMFGSLVASYVIGFIGVSASVQTSTGPIALVWANIWNAVGAPEAMPLAHSAVDFVVVSIAFSYITALTYIRYHAGILTAPQLPVESMYKDFGIAISQAVCFGFAVLDPRAFTFWVGVVFLLALRRQWSVAREFEKSTLKFVNRLRGDGSGQADYDPAAWERQEERDIKMIRQSLRSRSSSISVWARPSIVYWLLAISAVVAGGAARYVLKGVSVGKCDGCWEGWVAGSLQVAVAGGCVVLGTRVLLAGADLLGKEPDDEQDPRGYNLEKMDREFEALVKSLKASSSALQASNRAERAEFSMIGRSARAYLWPFIWVNVAAIGFAGTAVESEVIRLAVTLSLLASFGFVLNDRCDIEIDRANGLERFTHANAATLRAAERVCWVLAMSAVLVASTLGLTAGLLSAGIAVVLVLYSTRLRSSVPVATLLSAGASASPIWAPILLWGQVSIGLSVAMSAAPYLGLVGREIFLDIKDVDGDRAGGRSTIATQAGVAAAAKAGAAAMVGAAAFLGVVVAAVGPTVLLGALYLGIVVTFLAPAVVIASGPNGVPRAVSLSRWTKVGMGLLPLLILVAF